VSNQELIQAVKAIVLRFDPNAQVILYGSRARGDAQLDSDWNFLVLLDREKAREIDRDIHEALYTLELDAGEVLSAIIRTKGQWDTPLVRATPFHRFVTPEGIPV